MTTRSLPPPRPLAEVLAYKNPRVINNFRRSYEVSRREAQLLFREVLKFLWLSRRTTLPLAVLMQQKLFDEMWHSFILHTADYQAFCTTYLGAMAHHSPESHRDPRARVSKQQRRQDRARMSGAVDTMVDLVADELGLATAVRWYRTFSQRYTPEFIDKVRIPVTVAMAPSKARRAAPRKRT